jgi:hypothetical protein
MSLFCGKRKLRPAVGPSLALYQNLMTPEAAATEPSVSSKLMMRERMKFLHWGTDGYE